MKKHLSILTIALLYCVLSVTSANAQTSQSTKLTWAPPELVDPITLNITSQKRSFKLDKTKDYRLIFKEPLINVRGGLNITGGHNVVVIGGEIRFDKPGREGKALDCRGIYINHNTGTVHIEGVLIHGKALREGFNIGMFNEETTLQLQNIRVDTVTGSFEGHHADVVQTWAGPTVLRIDHLTGITGYQGFFLHPVQHKKSKIAPELFDFRNINLISINKGYLLWQATKFPLTTKNVYVQTDAKRFPALTLWPKGDPIWKDVILGAPPAGDFVPADVPGMEYVSPGYLDEVASNQ
ncbi:MAG TPA: hypothetical protein DCM28_01145 [Phycisphaerales bacterium]|nr:hypothetical protein [Phycisphaerales bacterium]HCD34146.1 hypothetical protein [Phycisphaerales bacterium]|tara:strand:+ start:1561 stop:2445 length:885 start_codon:yes stop_codon:yes gene_type:complete